VKLDMQRAEYEAGKEWHSALTTSTLPGQPCSRPSTDGHATPGTLALPRVSPVDYFGDATDQPIALAASAIRSS
jgi:hypothetical protein